MIRRFEEIREHFEKEASIFDAFFFKVMPGYDAMTQALAESLPFPRRRRIEVIDLGCGTGNLAARVLASFPSAHVTCVDMAQNMLTMAKAKLAHRKVSFHQADIREFPLGRYDAVVSSMALHHIEGREKPAFYRRLFRALEPGGVFRAIDIFTGCTPRLQGLFMDKWRGYMRAQGVPASKIGEIIRRHQREDRPVRFPDELKMLEAAGFGCVDVLKKEFNFAVYGGMKR